MIAPTQQRRHGILESYMRISQAARDARKKVQMARLAAAQANELDEDGQPTYPRMFAAQPSEVRRKAVFDEERAAYRVAKYAAQDAIIAEAGAGVAAFASGGGIATVSAGADDAGAGSES